LIVCPTKDRQEIDSILKHPEIYDTITDDSCDPSECYEIPINNDYQYIGGYVNGKIIAIMVYHKYNDGNKCHVQVLPEYRKTHALQFGEQSLIFRGTQPLYAEIPSLYQNVLDFAFRFGFEVIETKTQDFCKDGKLHDLHILRFNDGIFQRFNR
jgi:hypothetical protein